MGVLGVLLGCMGATVPGGGGSFFILITLYILATTNVRRGAFEMFNVIGVSLVVFFLVLSFSPYGAGRRSQESSRTRKFLPNLTLTARSLV